MHPATALCLAWFCTTAKASWDSASVCLLLRYLPYGREASAISHRDLMLAVPANKPFDRPGWIFELKLDGFRVLAIRRGDSLRLLSRRGNDLLPCFPEIAACLLELPDIAL